MRSLSRSGAVCLVIWLHLSMFWDRVNSPIPKRLKPWGISLVIIAVIWTAITMTYVTSNACLQDQNGLACWITSGSFAEFLHETWLFK